MLKMKEVEHGVCNAIVCFYKRILFSSSVITFFGGNGLTTRFFKGDKKLIGFVKISPGNKLNDAHKRYRLLLGKHFILYMIFRYNLKIRLIQNIDTAKYLTESINWFNLICHLKWRHFCLIALKKKLEQV